MANGTAELMTPDGDANEERGIGIAELYANIMKLDGELRTTDDEASVVIPEQRVPTHDALDITEKADEAPPASKTEGGKTLYGTFDPQIRFAGGLSIEGMIRGREIIQLNRRRAPRHLGRSVVPRVLPGGR